MFDVKNEKEKYLNCRTRKEKERKFCQQNRLHISANISSSRQTKKTSTFNLKFIINFVKRLNMISVTQNY